MNKEITLQTIDKVKKFTRENIELDLSDLDAMRLRLNLDRELAEACSEDETDTQVFDYVYEEAEKFLRDHITGVEAHEIKTEFNRSIDAWEIDIEVS